MYLTVAWRTTGSWYDVLLLLSTSSDSRMLSHLLMRSILVYRPSLPADLEAEFLAERPRERKEVLSLLAREVSLMPIWMRFIQWSVGLRVG